MNIEDEPRESSNRKRDNVVSLHGARLAAEKRYAAAAKGEQVHPVGTGRETASLPVIETTRHEMSSPEKKTMEVSTAVGRVQQLANPRWTVNDLPSTDKKRATGISEWWKRMIPAKPASSRSTSRRH